MCNPDGPRGKMLGKSLGWKQKHGATKNIYLYFIDYAKAFDCVDHNKLWKIFQEMGIPDNLPPEKSVFRSRINRTRHGTMDWFQIGIGVCQGCVLSSCLFNLYAE